MWLFLQNRGLQFSFRESPLLWSYLFTLVVASWKRYFGQFSRYLSFCVQELKFCTLSSETSNCAALLFPFPSSPLQRLFSTLPACNPYLCYLAALPLMLTKLHFLFTAPTLVFRPSSSFTPSEFMQWVSDTHYSLIHFLKVLSSKEFF